MLRFKIKVDMSNFFNDERRLSIVSVDSYINIIKDLQDHVENLFGIVGIRFLSSDGCYLHPEDIIDVLENIQILKVFKPPKKFEDNVSICSLQKSNKNHEASTRKNCTRHTSNLRKPNVMTTTTTHNPKSILILHDDAKGEINKANRHNDASNWLINNGSGLVRQQKDSTFILPNIPTDLVRNTKPSRVLQFK